MSSGSKQNRGPLHARLVFRLSIGFGVAGVALWLAVRRVDLTTLRSALAASSAYWEMIALLSVLLTFGAGVVRWRLLFYPQHGERRSGNLISALLIGQAINIILPLRIGEIARVYMFSAAEGLAPARVLVTIAVERLVDIVLFGLAAAALTLLLALPDWISASGQGLAITGLAAMVTVLFISVRPDSFFGLAQWVVKALPDRFRQRLRPHVEEGAKGLSSLRNAWAGVGLWTLSISILVLSATTNYLLFKAFALSLPPIAALFLLVVLQVGNAAISVPGNIGVFHYLTVLALGVYGVGRELALAYAMVLYAVALLPKIIIGVVVMAMGPKGFSFRSTLSRSEPEDA
jgi:glycosyltransferase 2 family protein